MNILKQLAVVKVTWKDAVGFLAALAGSLSAANVANLGLSPSASHVLITVGLVLIAVCRVADAIDYHTTGPVDVGALSAQVSALTNELAKAKASGNLPSGYVAVKLTDLPPAATPAAPTT